MGCSYFGLSEREHMRRELFELGKAYTHSFAPSLPLGSNEAEEARIMPGLNPARASEKSGRSAATPGLSHARIAAA